jgi:hypothetical protein
MRTTILTLLAVASMFSIANTARAEEAAPSEEDKVLIGPNVKHGGYGAPEVKVTSFTGDAALLVGGQAGWIIDRQLVLGVAGYGLAMSHSPTEELLRPEGPSRIAFGYGGARVAWTHRPQRMFHASFGVLVGAGGVGVVTHDIGAGRYYTHNTAAFFAAEPATELELNVTSFMRVSASVGYRFITGTDEPGLHSSDMSGVAGGLAFKFGVF